MATKITVELPDNLYKRAQQFARKHQQEMGEAISTLIKQGLAADNADEGYIDWTEPDPAVDREMEAYIAMHPALKELYFGKYVAVYHGELVDYDTDFGTLAERIDERYPDEFVWMSEVGPEPIETIFVRSPRIVRD
jgi:hypothetical protein